MKKIIFVENYIEPVTYSEFVERNRYAIILKRSKKRFFVSMNWGHFNKEAGTKLFSDNYGSYLNYIGNFLFMLYKIEEKNENNSSL